MNLIPLKQTIEGLMLNLKEEGRIQEVLPADLSPVQEMWLEAKQVQFLEMKEKLEGLNPNLRETELEDLTLEQFLKEVSEELMGRHQMN
jgi:hypothetical protein